MAETRDCNKSEKAFDCSHTPRLAESSTRGMGQGKEAKDRNREDTLKPIELIFEDVKVPEWQNQITLRGFVLAFLLSTLFCLLRINSAITMSNPIPLGVSAGLLSYAIVKARENYFQKCDMLSQRFTRQENVVIMSCILASCSVTDGFGTYLFGMSEVVAKQVGDATDAQDIKNPHVGWMTAFLLAVSFIGLFSLIPFRKSMIVDSKMVFPSAAATAQLVNCLHAPQITKLAKKQVKILVKAISLNFLWNLFQWFFAAARDCGFSNFPILGLTAYDMGYYFDWSAGNVAVGMLCPPITSISMFIGLIILWGFKQHVAHGTNVDGKYQDLFAGSIIVGDCLYYFLKFLTRAFVSVCHHLKHKDVLSYTDLQSPEKEPLSYNEKHRSHFFLKEHIPSWVSITGYIASSALCISILPVIFDQVEWYHVLVICICAPMLALGNARGNGLTDMAFSNIYGIIAIQIVGAWMARLSHGAAIMGLVAYGVAHNILSTSSATMQNLKTGYMTLSSPNSVFISQVIGTAIGSLISPCLFWLFLKGFPDMGTPNSEYPMRLAFISRIYTLDAMEFFSDLPKNSLLSCGALFSGAIIINTIRDSSKKLEKFVPIPLAMALPFITHGTSTYPIDVCIGGLILFGCRKMNNGKAEKYIRTAAAGLICGDGLWNLLHLVFRFAGIKPPICMKFLSRETNNKVNACLAS